MINAIIEAIGAALGGEFGDDYIVYMEEAGQGLKEPCFFISCQGHTNERFLGNRYFQTNQLRIRYFPVTAEKQRECNGVAERMWQCLEYVTIEGEDKPVRGTKMKYEVVDGVLHFSVNYDCFTCSRAGRQTTMGELESSTHVKEGGD